MRTLSPPRSARFSPVSPPNDEKCAFLPNKKEAKPKSTTEETQSQKKTHYWPRVGDAGCLDQHIVEFGAAAAAAPAVKLLEGVNEIGAQGAADTAALEVDDVLFRDEVGRDF